MSQKPGTQKLSAEKAVTYIRWRTRKQHLAEDMVRQVLEGLCGRKSVGQA
ncbi:hypothetical protein SAMN04488245_1016 [Alloyangia pacifica]|uniref:Uncharacterized protein n=1 Tax=Alloyangia pacifica TaxID=311180 RepID=A0A1I6QDS1_9RHOB|nr:hypothetical protein SAMN04488245_1016 [Alloyangia pacifica]SFS50594.1 hypothetical protein SAMN04488050_1027 [Alloyangia pacifica]